MAVAERDFASAVEQASVSVALWRTIGDQSGLAVGLTNLGRAQQAAGKNDEAMTAYRESLQIAEATGSSTTVTSALTNMATLDLLAGNLESARAMNTRALGLLSERGDHWGSAVVRANLGDVACELWEADEAWKQYSEALAGFLRSGDLIHAAQVLRRFAAVAHYRGAAAEAATLAGAAAVVVERSGLTLDTGSTADHEETVQAVREALTDEEFAARWADGAAMDGEELLNFVSRAA